MKYDNRTVYAETCDKGLEIKFYDDDGMLKYVVGCQTMEEVALELIQWCWAMGTEKVYTPTVWKDGLPYQGEDILKTMK